MQPLSAWRKLSNAFVRPPNLTSRNRPPSPGRDRNCGENNKQSIVTTWQCQPFAAQKDDHERPRRLGGEWAKALLYLSILSPARPGPLARPGPGPPTNLTGRAWVEILKPAKFFLARARPEMLFLVVLHYKMCGRPAQARARPEPGSKIEVRYVQWDGHGQDFFGPK
jgi:hypothetical protein